MRLGIGQWVAEVGGAFSSVPSIEVKSVQGAIAVAEGQFYSNMIDLEVPNNRCSLKQYTLIPDHKNSALEITLSFG